MASICLSILSLWIQILMLGYTLASAEYWPITDDCGKERGCYRIPLGCKNSGCDYILTWQNESSDGIHFQYAARFTTKVVPWAGFGITERSEMPGATVVDCIVNGSSSQNQVVIQMSSNHGHKNVPLTNKYLGLIPSSLEGSYADGYIFCNFTRIRVLNASDPEASKVKNLTKPYNVLFATGPTDLHGTKFKHDYVPSIDPFASENLVDFNKYSDDGAMGSTTKRNPYIRCHATLMIVAWMVLASVGMIISRYMKHQWKEHGALYGKPIWFQVHRTVMACTLIIVAVGIILIFRYHEWKFILPGTGPTRVHPILGITVACLVLLNVIGGLFRPHLHSSYRPYFRWFHTIAGHGSHLLAVATMYLGTLQESAMMPPWSKWVVVMFGIWRVLSDIVLTGSQLYFKERPFDYVAIANNEADDTADKAAGLRSAVLIVYLIGVVVLATTLITAANVSF